MGTTNHVHIWRRTVTTSLLVTNVLILLGELECRFAMKAVQNYIPFQPFKAAKRKRRAIILPCIATIAFIRRFLLSYFIVFVLVSYFTGLSSVFLLAQSWR